MGTKRLSMRQYREIMRLKYEAGLGHRAIARACSVGVGTVSEYVGRAERAGLCWPLPEDLMTRRWRRSCFRRPRGGAVGSECCPILGICTRSSSARE